MSEITQYAPVVIPTLNRYNHLRRCLESLERCTWAEYTDVYVALDYPPSEKYVDGWKRIDDFCILSGKITLGSHIHISAYVALYGAMGIVMEDYTGISPKSAVYSAMDDFSGEYLIGPIHPDKTTNVTGGVVTIKRFVQVGSNVVVFPNLIIGEGVAVGACSLVTKSLSAWGIYVGVPVKKVKDRSKKMKELVFTK